MKRLLFGLVMVAAGLLLMPLAVGGVFAQDSTGAPPVAQTLVREGDFAVKLAKALELGDHENEAQAEEALASKGITPRNGWISDYPVTPDIVDELKSSIESAADANQLAMGKYTATKAFEDLTVEVGIPVVAGSQWDYAGDSPDVDYDASATRDYGNYADPEVVNNYYYDEGPPVVTYYRPPWDYYYLYSWVPHPFWYSSFFFPGFFVLNDFHRVVVVNRGINRFAVNRISNRVFDRVNRRTGVIDPVNRRTGRGLRAVSDVRRRNINSGTLRNSAASIARRSADRGQARLASINGTNRGFNRGQALSSSRTIGRSQEQRFRGGDNILRNQNRNDRVARVNPATPERFRGRNANELRSRETRGGFQGSQRNFQSRSARSFERTFPGRSFSERRSFNTPRATGGSSFRSFNSSSRGGSSFRSFNGGNRGGSSFRGFSGGGRSGGGFSQGGRSSGGFARGGMGGGGRSGGGGGGRGGGRGR